MNEYIYRFLKRREEGKEDGKKQEGSVRSNKERWKREGQKEARRTG